MDVVAEAVSEPTTETRMSNLMLHAERELKLAGMYDADADYGGGAIAGEVLKLMAVFAEGEHSGGSAALTLELFTKLARFEPLTPITSNPDDWMDVSGASGQPMWQSRRAPSVFSKDGGRTWYDLNAVIAQAQVSEGE
jgi:hypothetical protein